MTIDQTGVADATVPNREPTGADTGPETDPMAPRAQPLPAPRWAAPAAGLVSAAVSVCAGLLVAAVIEVVSPLDAVGSEFIDHTPPWLKRLAIDWFGTDDKLALRVGMVLTIALASMVVGAIGRRRPIPAAIALAAFGVLGAVVAVGRPGETAGAAVPPLLGAAVGAGLLWHLCRSLRRRDPARERPGRSRAPDGWDRRRFLSTTGSAAAVAAVAAVGSRRLEDARLDRLEDAVPDSLPPVGGATGAGATAAPLSAAAPIPPEATLSPVTPFITPNGDFYRIDTALSVPRIELSTWSVRIGGMVDRPLRLSYDDLLARPQVERTITLTCVSNEVGDDLIGTATWQGVLLRDLLEEAGVGAGAEQVFGTSIDGWTCGFPIELALDGRDAMIALGMNGEPLPLRHGFPARVVVPGLYGYVSATKWLSRLDLTTWDAAEGYWVPRGWAREAPIKTQSRIDVPRRGERLRAGPVVVAGIAWAQHRGIAAVEVRVDDGPWRAAELGTEVSVDAWRQWRFTWDALPGRHTLYVRATDRTGEVQTAEVSRPDPDGATGHHTRRVTVDEA